MHKIDIVTYTCEIFVIFVNIDSWNDFDIQNKFLLEKLLVEF